MGFYLNKVYTQRNDMAISNTIYKICLRCFQPLKPNKSLLLKTSSSAVYKTDHRFYRSRKTDGIGRITGLNIVEPPPVTRKEKGRWNEDKVLATGENQFNALNFTISGFDLVLVEEFAKFTHQLMNKHRQNVVEAYALPAYDVVLKSADSNTISVDRMRSVFTLRRYQRVVQVKDIPSTLYPVLLQVMMHSVPQSVEFQVKEHTEEDLAMRYQKRVEIEAEKLALQALLDSR